MRRWQRVAAGVVTGVPGGVLAGWAAVRWSGFEPGWPWVPVVAFTPYAGGAAVVVLLAAGLLRLRAATALALVAAVGLGAAVLPRALPDGDAGGAGLRVLSANLLVGSADPAALMALVERLRPDVLALQELTPAAVERLETAGLRRALPYVVARPGPGAGGSALYARHRLTPVAGPPPGTFEQAAGVLELPGGPRVEVVSVHPCAVHVSETRPCWRRELDALPRADGTLRVLAGDFNATLDHLPLRRLLASGYRDAADAAGRGLTPTWPARGWHGLPGVAIDHVLVPEGVSVRGYDVQAPVGSDHRPVFAELVLPASHGS
ncbi:endonuclease/exonuclease/phosphatase family protein [Nonomuraea roseoviolacea subsp. roseoviolacea]|uniref:Endonuclease/exonuclease/phosphatase (EEP) superfamily protein YafD n=1 Tax=Nonomuraea roseoviolacea subsp. carminata TaxID=160689 RepID=A0ABT1JSE6_9ACTN|nr:endonuclease/exonuclease/phosphatase family protein [Nonomuraea roseoviolacea]MCP2344645.1 endonuclease/exonuclease/phosphatase (EEP) superfamily protein YafD [Nonomuraea roseoviolacea subsp. carminata]